MSHSDSDARSLDLFEAVERESTLAQRVGQKIQQVIVQNRLRPGDRLPSERDLAERFGVSRTVIREAVRSLMAKGILEVRAGSGTIVRAPSTSFLSDYLELYLSMRSGKFDYRKVVEVRRLLEVEIAGLAAERRDEEDLRTLERILAQAEEHLDDPDAFVELDVQFHSALAQATHNELFLVLLESIAGVMVQVRLLGLRVPGTPQRALAYHRDIYQNVQRGDREGARRAMDRHMDEAESTMREAMAGEADG